MENSRLKIDGEILAIYFKRLYKKGFWGILVSMNDSKENSVNESQNPEYVDETIRELCHLIKVADSEEFTYQFFVNLFTAPERKDFANRWLLVKEIDKGTTQREIAKKFNMSLCKITRGSKELRQPDSAFRKMLDMLNITNQ